MNETKKIESPKHTHTHTRIYGSKYLEHQHSYTLTKKNTHQNTEIKRRRRTKHKKWRRKFFSFWNSSSYLMSLFHFFVFVFDSKRKWIITNTGDTGDIGDDILIKSKKESEKTESKSKWWWSHHSVIMMLTMDESNVWKKTNKQCVCSCVCVYVCL